MSPVEKNERGEGETVTKGYMSDKRERRGKKEVKREKWEVEMRLWRESLRGEIWKGD